MYVGLGRVRGRALWLGFRLRRSFHPGGAVVGGRLRRVGGFCCLFVGSRRVPVIGRCYSGGCSEVVVGMFSVCCFAYKPVLRVPLGDIG